MGVQLPAALTTVSARRLKNEHLPCEKCCKKRLKTVSPTSNRHTLRRGQLDPIGACRCRTTTGMSPLPRTAPEETTVFCTVWTKHLSLHDGHAKGIVQELHLRKLDGFCTAAPKTTYCWNLPLHVHRDVGRTPAPVESPGLLHSFAL